ncbi:DUF1016 N-terminal domain-containing protein [Phocaeicola salanitronis]|uniref:DUF1016 N-terminal domain-containing protein n=1 Tax=Phocaeicola salanitronis TaxID=376805 RepID=UPI0032086F58
MLQFYWSLGRDIVTLHAESRWGDKILKSLSDDDLRKALPKIKGLSETSIRYAKRFYMLYNGYFTNSPKQGVNFLCDKAPSMTNDVSHFISD